MPRDHARYLVSCGICGVILPESLWLQNVMLNLISLYRLVLYALNYRFFFSLPLTANYSIKSRAFRMSSQVFYYQFRMVAIF